jgi:hypothetical protein
MAAAAGPNAAVLEAARQARVGQLPLWFGEPKKDPYTAEGFINRVNVAREVLQWDENVTIRTFEISLRGAAIEWFRHLAWRGIPNFNLASWDDVSKEFISFYGLTRTARTTTTSLQDMAMKPDERPGEFANRVLGLIDDLSLLDPAATFNPAQTQHADVAALEGYDALADPIKRAAVLHIATPAIRWTLSNVAKNVFIAGLMEPYRTEVMKTENVTSLHRALEVARHLEAVKVSKSARVQEIEVQPVHTSDNSPIQKLDEIKNEICAMRTDFKMVKSNAKCFYCGLLGHFQAECRKRLADRQPMKSNQFTPNKTGKKRTDRKKRSTRRVHGVEQDENSEESETESESEEDTPQETQIHSLETSTLSLNY